jgi:hypothetical protein
VTSPLRAPAGLRRLTSALDGVRHAHLERLVIWVTRIASIACSISLCIPFWRGGWRVSGDHAPHIAEILDLAQNSSGWSDLAFAGFPLGTLHSPLWYGLLVGIVKLGAPAWMTYCVGVTCTEIFLGLVALEVGARRAQRAPALVVAVLVQTQSLLVAGPSGILSGMWTFGLACAFFIWLVDRLHERIEGQVPLQIAALIGAIGLTHTFAIFAVVAVVFVRSLMLLLSGPEARRQIPILGGASLLGALAASAYWMAAFLTIDTREVVPVVSFGWPNFQIFFGPLLDDGFAPLGIVQLYLPTLADLILWILAALSLLRLGQLQARERSLVATALATMTLVLFVVSHIAEWQGRSLFGPIPWRILVVVRCLLLVPAVSLFPRARLSARTQLLTLILAVFVSSFWIAQRERWLRSEMPGPRDVSHQQVIAVQRAVARLAPTIRDRVYVQNTHGLAPGPLAGGHALALLPARAGVRAVGSYYSLVPFATDRWLTSFGGPLVGSAANDSFRSVVDERLDNLGVEALVVSETSSIEALRRWAPEYTDLGMVGPFGLFRRPRPGMARSTDNIAIRDFALEDGEIAFDVDYASATHDVMIAVSYNECWHIIEAPEHAYLARRMDGLMRLSLPPGSHHIVLRYERPRWPLFISLAAWSALIALAWRTRRKRQPARPVETMLAMENTDH